MIKFGIDTLKTKRTLEVDGEKYDYYDLEAAGEAKLGDISRLPFSLKVLLENLLRFEDGISITVKHLEALTSILKGSKIYQEIAYRPARVLMQDFTGVPAIVDLAAMRDAMGNLGGDSDRINPLSRADLVIDHSVQVDKSGSLSAFQANVDIEMSRNRERYEFLRWGQRAFNNFNVIPPGTGICHQVNLEHLAQVVWTAEVGASEIAYPDTLVGTDSHTTMVNGLAVLGWGVGGIEAEAAMLGQPLYMLAPEVVGLRLEGALPEGATATDLVLTVTELLRTHGVVGKFVEFCGDGLDRLSLADRATLSNMAPEYGATMGFFPVDVDTLRYLRATGRPGPLVDLVEAYTKEQGLFRTSESPEPRFSDLLTLDMKSVEPSLAGPRRPQDRVALTNVKSAFEKELATTFKVDLKTSSSAQANGGNAREPNYEAFRVPVELRGAPGNMTHGDVLIAAITSCTNTSNPSVMIGAGVLAKKAVDRGLSVPPHVKTSLAPGSRVVTRYLEASGLLPYLESLGFHVVGYGCTTCIGNSGPLAPAISEAVHQNDLVAAAVLSGNRNFEGRVNPDVRANYLASPPLVVAYALAGTVDIDFEEEPIGVDSSGEPVHLREIWPTQEEVREEVIQALHPKMFEQEYGNVFRGNEDWNKIPVAGGDIYKWSDESTYIQEPPFFTELTLDPPAVKSVEGARVLALLGDSGTTDHISPAGAIPGDGPAGRFLMAHSVEEKDFNSFGSRRGNHEVMMRGTFANIRMRNQLVPGVEGGYTCLLYTSDAADEGLCRSRWSPYH